MPDDAESRRQAAGTVTPNAAKDAEWRSQVGGLPAFMGEDETPASGGLQVTGPACGSATGPTTNIDAPSAVAIGLL